VDGAVRFTGGALVLNDTATFASGIDMISGGFTVNTAIDTPTLTMGGGTLGGTGVLTIADTFTWTGGTITGTGSLVIAPLATGTIGGFSSKSLDGGRQLVNEGTLTLSGTNLVLSNGSGPNATLDNRGTFSVTDEADITRSNFTGQPVFVKNSGTFVKSGPGTTTSISPTGFTNSGLLSIQGGVLAFTPFAQTATGITQLAGGNLSASTLTFAGGRVTGVGTITANVTNSGAVFSPGETGTRTLTIAGTYTQLAGGTLEFDLDGTAASGAFDKLAVTGAATLNGTVALRNSLALTSEVFPLVSYASRSGTFPTITVENNGTGTASYLAARADFAVTAGGSRALAPQLASSYQDWVGLINQTQITLPTQSISRNQNGSTFSAAAPPAEGWDNAPTADPDHDGSANLLEYAFQTDPLDAASIPAFDSLASQTHSGCIEWTCEMRSNALDIICILECSTEAGQWKPLSADPVGVVGITETALAPGIKKSTLILNPALAPRKFLRWSVVLQN
jgi:hypothetical protein